jgi:hypothetical protein
MYVSGLVWCPGELWRVWGRLCTSAQNVVLVGGIASLCCCMTCICAGVCPLVFLSLAAAGRWWSVAESNNALE